MMAAEVMASMRGAAFARAMTKPKVAAMAMRIAIIVRSASRRIRVLRCFLSYVVLCTHTRQRARERERTGEAAESVPGHERRRGSRQMKDRE